MYSSKISHPLNRYLADLMESTFVIMHSITCEAFKIYGIILTLLVNKKIHNKYFGCNHL